MPPFSIFLCTSLRLYDAECDCLWRVQRSTAVERHLALQLVDKVFEEDHVAGVRLG
jgi:hypothetical protein